jgi:ribosomal protein S12 methylthiotransferase
MSAQIKVGFVSLGCPKNLVDTEVMLGIAQKAGCNLVTDEKSADIIIINTCCFIGDAQRESQETILEFSQLKKTGKIKKLIVTGCLPQRYKNDLPALYPEVDNFLGSSDFPDIASYLNLVSSEEPKVKVGSPDYIYSAKSPRINSQAGSSVYIKIAEGCSEQCSFCIVPKLRGRYRSRLIGDIVDEAKAFSDNGVREINLIAQNLTGYGKDLDDKSTLEILLRELAKINDLKWIRLIYNYPRDFSESLIDLMVSEPKICRYIDLPLQHIDDEILSKMGRRTTSAEIKSLLNKLKQRVNGLVIRTSFIVGFPGETEEKFKTLLNFVRDYKFDKIAIFPYSAEAGTAAAKLRDDVPPELKLERYDELTEMKKRVALASNRKFVGKKFDFLPEGKIEKNGKSYFKGRFYGQAPEVDGNVFVKAPMQNTIEPFSYVRFTGADPYDFQAIPVKSQGK